jgi:hypothetical protein
MQRSEWGFIVIIQILLFIVVQLLAKVTGGFSKG